MLIGIVTLVATAMGYCPNGDVVRLDFTQWVTIHGHGEVVHGVEYPMGVVEATVPVDGDKSNFHVMVTATKKGSSKPAPANVYDCATGTEDPDLNMSCQDASVPKAVIIQEMNQGSYNMDVPDDDWRGGALHFEFSGIPDLVIVEVLEVTLLDFEKFSTMEIVAKDDKTSVYGISPGQDGSSQTINTEGSGKIKEMTVNFPESGGVGMIKMCVENPLIRGDPHVRTIDNQRVNVFLEVGPWVEMMRGPTFALFGHVFNKANDRSTQWIDGLAVVDAEQKTVLNITIPHDKAVGEVHDRDGISYLRVDFDGIELDATNRAYSYFSKKNETLLTLNATKLSSSVRGGRSPIYNDKLTVETPDFTFVAEVGREDNRKNFDSLEEQIGYTHIDAGFPVLDPETVHGPLVDIIYGKDTPAARMWRDKANAYGAAVRVSR